MSSVETSGLGPPIIAVVGVSGSGKTTLIEALISKLRSRGYRVATIKHVPQDLPFGKPHKDSWRHIRAGSEATLIVSTGKVVLIKPTLGELSLDEAARFLSSDYDIVLAEGFKKSGVPKIKVCKGTKDDDAFDLKNLIAIVSRQPAKGEIKNFSPDETDRLTDFLEEMFLKHRRNSKR